MIDFVKNDGGRKAAGYKGTVGDCVVRAVSILEGGTAETYQAAYETSRVENQGVINRKRKPLSRKRADGDPSPEKGSLKAATPRVLKAHGFVKVDLREWTEKPTFSQAYERYGNCIVSTTRHIAAVVNGSLQDLFNGLTYEWENEYGQVEVRERKAMSIWVKSN